MEERMANEKPRTGPAGVLVSLSRRILVFKDKRIAGEIGGLNDGPCRYEDVSGRIGAYL